MARSETPTLAARLLTAVDPLPYPERMRQLVVWARQLERDGLLRDVLEELEGTGTGAAGSGPAGSAAPGASGGARRWGGFGRRGAGRDSAAAASPVVPGRAYERGIAVLLASIAADTDWLAARLADPDPYVRGHALRAAGAARVPDEAFEAALADAPEAVRDQLLRAVVTGRRTALADRVVDGVRAEWGDAAAARLLPACSGPVAARLLPGLFHAVPSWSVLAKRHHEAVLDVVAHELAAAPEALRDACWHRCGPALYAVAGRAPQRVLDLLERHTPTSMSSYLLPHLGAFAAADPARTGALLTGPWGVFIRLSGHLRQSVLRKLARAGTPEAAASVLAYARSIAGESGFLALLLRVHPPAERPALYAAAVEGRSEGPAAVDGPVLDVLPRRAAADRARRVAERARAEGAYWTTVLAAESYLPCAEVREGLVAATRRPVADDRADAWPFLVRNAARSRDTAEVALLLRDMADRLTNEQDPVRSEALYALSAVHTALLTADAVPHLDKLTADAVAARDCSHDTRDALTTLALAALRQHAAGGSQDLVGWALRTLTRISGSTGRAELGGLDRVLRRGQEHDVFRALRPWIEAGAEKADYGLLFALAHGVGRRAHGMADLQELLWQAVRFGSAATAQQAIGLWLDPPATRDERVARVLAQEPSAAVLDPVHAVLTARRTDLLDQLLGAAPPYGRFLERGAAWTVPAGPWAVRRWVPRQQDAWVRQLGAAAGDAKLPLADRAAALARCAAVPGSLELLRQWTASPDTVLAEAALAALAHTDRPGDALPALLAHAGSERARVAVYAATRASRYVAPSALTGQLREVLTGRDVKVTSRKEAARLAATRLPAPVAAAVLAEAYAAPGAHRDVRAACVAFAGGLLGAEPVWELLADAAACDEPVLRTAVLRMPPLDVAPAHRERYARLVRDVSATGDDETAVLAYRTLPDWAPWSPEAADVLGAACADLALGRVAWQAAAHGLVTAAVTSVDGDAALCAALAGLVGAAADGDGDGDGGGSGEGDLDLPARRRVEYVVDRLAGLRGATARAVSLRAGELLAAHDAFTPQAACLLVAALDVTGPPDRLVADLERLAALHDGRPALVAGTAAAVAGRVSGRDVPLDAESLLPVARALAGRSGHAEAVFAVAVTRAVGVRVSWPTPWREVLGVLRRHGVPDARDAALAVSTTP
ncbi:hypothetical protein [Streptomyces sp. NPDC059063]|uniref:hypothetical protein n=1 Tax=unclassified Streptomyces TaxID=2593676 RepID=UPI00368AFC82